MEIQFIYIGKPDFDSKEIQQLAHEFSLPTTLHKGKTSVGAHIAKMANSGDSKAIYACLFHSTLFEILPEFKYCQFLDLLKLKKQKEDANITFTITPCDRRRLPVFRRAHRVVFGNTEKELSFSLPPHEALAFLYYLRRPPYTAATNLEFVIKTLRKLRQFLSLLRLNYDYNNEVAYTLSCNDPFFSSFYYSEKLNINTLV